MASAATESLTLRMADDLHVHLRQGALMHMAVSHIRAGGVARCLVMPNTKPPIQTARQALRYRDELRRLDEQVDYLMTVFLSPELDATEVRQAAKLGVTGVKCYPQGVTTNSDTGVCDLRSYDETFQAMSDEGLVLQIHGEAPSSLEHNVCLLNAESAFLPELERLHNAFPQLRIVLEHVTTAEAVGVIKRVGDTVAATITAHHLELTVDDWAGNPHNFCKPVAKTPLDREALRAVVEDGHERFFLGSDSAPHPKARKECAAARPGVFTTPLLMPYLAHTFEAMGCLDRLAAFTSQFGRRFYGLAETAVPLRLGRAPQVVPDSYADVVPFLAGKTLNWSVEP